MSAFDQAVANAKPGVQRTRELDRIAQLPRRRLDLEANTIDGEPIPDLTPVFLKLGGPCEKFEAKYDRCPICSSGTPALWPTQSAALFEAERGYGLFGPMGVGSGKTLVTLLLPDVLSSERAVLLVPAGLKNQLVSRDMEAYGRHFHLPLERITVVAYTELSDAGTADILEKINPDLIIADECHSLARATAARTKRFIRFMKASPNTRFCGLSGTVTRRSLKDYAHLAEIALRAGSPVPGNWSDLNDWADALDPVSDPKPPGALKIFAASDDARLNGNPEDVQAAVREGYRRRLTDTIGVVATSESWEGASLLVAASHPKLPDTVSDAIVKLKKTWEIDGEEIEDAVRMSEFSRQLSVGFYYRWLWNDGVKDLEWLRARADWHKEVRNVLRLSRPGLDSPLLVTNAVKRGELPGMLATWNAWQVVAGRYNPTPPVAPVWLNTFAAEAACEWGARQEAGIIWYSRTAIGDKLEEFGVPVYGAGADAGEADPSIYPVIACSIASQSTGKNLQRYRSNLVMEPPPSGASWEQLMGRTHRPGQQADEVTFEVFAHTGELMGSLYRAVADAEYVFSTQGQRQKILAARRVGW